MKKVPRVEPGQPSSVDWHDRISATIKANFDRIVALRRHLHAHPEPSHEELATSLHLYQQFSEMELPVRMGPEGRGVIVDSRDDGEVPQSRRLALRADCDALRIADEKQVAYHSQVAGVMHACGHDAHSAILFGAVVALDELAQKGDLPVPVQWRGIFQPAEETCCGAHEMTAAGALEEVEAILALHVDPTRATGTIGVRPGIFTASCDDMRLVIHGRGGHGARPHLSKDPIGAAAQLISTLYQFVPRATDSQDAVVVSIGQIRGGENPNVIPETVELAGTLRTLDHSVREQAIDQICALSKGVEEITGTKIEVRFEASIPSVYNDSHLNSLVSRAADEMLGPDQLQVMPRASMGSEDFAVYLDHVPGVMFRLGCAVDPSVAPGLHTPLFDVDERCLAIGANLLARCVVEWAIG